MFEYNGCTHYDSAGAIYWFLIGDGSRGPAEVYLTHNRARDAWQLETADGDTWHAPALMARCIAAIDADDMPARLYAEIDGIGNARYIGIHNFSGDFAIYLFEDDDARRSRIALCYDDARGWFAHRYEYTEAEIDASIREIGAEGIERLRAMLPADDVPAALVNADRICVPA